MNKSLYQMLAVMGLGLGVLLLAKPKTKEPEQAAIVKPGTVTVRYMGSQFTLRLPRGTYDMVSGDGLLVLATRDSGGTTTDLIIVVLTEPSPFTTKPRFIDKNDSKRQFTITVHARRMPRAVKKARA